MAAHDFDRLATRVAERRLTRRSVLRGAAGGAALAGAASLHAPALVGAAAPPPNILVIIVDEMREHQWFPNQQILDAQLPALARLRNDAVHFTQHYTAVNMCTPSRGGMVTGLYSHQNGVMLTLAGQLSSLPPKSFLSAPTMSQNPPTSSTSAPTGEVSHITLDPVFPTWGSMLRQFGYETYWYGKWHLADNCGMEPYGFGGGTCPSPDGGPGQGLTVDPAIATQFIQWMQEQGTRGPWCTTVSLVNPHDIQWYPRWTRQVSGEAAAPSFFSQLPPNYETIAHLVAQRKPQLQLAQINLVNEVFGVVPHAGPGFETGWTQMLDSYLQMESYVDAQIGRVLDALAANPAVANNTIVIFTADHGDYAGSHGLRGKGGGVYDEGIRVPFYVKDPTGRFAMQPDVPRNQLTSSVDLAPLLLTLGSGGSDWRHEPQFAHLADRFDISTVLRDPAAPGRPYVITTTDEDSQEFSGLPLFPFLQGAPFHVIGLRTADAKVGLYSNWKEGTIELDPSGQQTEYYDYRTDRGRMELDNTARPTNTAYRRLLDQLMTDAIPHELRKPLPTALQAAQQRTLQGYIAQVAADKAKASKEKVTPPSDQ